MLEIEKPETIAESGSSNLVKLSGTPDVGQSLAQTPTSSNPLSRNQRCFSQFDRKTDCYRNGACFPESGNVQGRPERTGDVISHTWEVGSRLSTGMWPPFTVAVCGTQTRMPRGFKSMLNQIHALSAPTDNMAGEVRKNRSYRITDYGLMRSPGKGARYV